MFSYFPQNKRKFMNRKTNLQKLLTLLRDREWHPASELAENVSWRFGHTVFEADKKGYKVEKRKIAHNKFEYRLLESA
jgi:hypothetical protein